MTIILFAIKIEYYRSEALNFSITGTRNMPIEKSLSKFFKNEFNFTEDLLKMPINFEIYQEIQDINLGLPATSSSTAESTVLIQNIRIFEDKIEKIEYYNKNIVHYNTTYKSLETTAKSGMLEMLHSILKYSSDGPVELILSSAKLLALGRINILDTLKKKSFVSIFLIHSFIGFFIC